MSTRAGAKSSNTKRFQNPAFFSGGFFDIDTYIGTCRFMIFCVIVIYGGRYIDSFGQWLWGLFGAELHVAPGKADWHARVALGIGATPLVVDLMNLVRIYRLRRYLKAARPKTDAEVALRLRELAERRAKELGPEAPPLVPTEPPPGPMQRWPLLHDVVWGWPLLLALPLPLLDRPIAAMLGILLGAGAYGVNHAVAKSRLSIGIKLAVTLPVGLAAVGLWRWLAPL